MMGALRYVDRFVRGRREVIERVKGGKNLGGFAARAAVMYLFFTAVYGFGMGSFRWVHPAFFLSDFVIGDGSLSITGVVDAMDAETMSFMTRDLRSTGRSLVGRTVRFNRTDPTPPFTITSVEMAGPACRLVVEGPQMVAVAPWRYAYLAALKVPALFVATLALCLPALYVLNIALGWRLRFAPTAAVALLAIAGTSVMLAVLAPVAIFFMILTDHYHFMMLLHVVIFAIAGAYGVQTLAVGLDGLVRDGEARPSSGRLIRAWLLLYMFVGIQMAWAMRPLVGTPYLVEFEALRQESSNFYVNLIGSVKKLADARR